MSRRGVIVLVFVLAAAGVGLWAYRNESFRKSAEELIQEGPTVIKPEVLDTTSEDSEYEAFTYPLSGAPDFVGYRVQVILDDGRTIHGTLDEVKSDVLLIRQKLGGGSVSVSVKKSQVVEFQQLVKRKRE